MTKNDNIFVVNRKQLKNKNYYTFKHWFLQILINKYVIKYSENFDCYYVYRFQINY